VFLYFYRTHKLRREYDNSLSAKKEAVVLRAAARAGAKRVRAESDGEDLVGSDLAGTRLESLSDFGSGSDSEPDHASGGQGACPGFEGNSSESDNEGGGRGGGGEGGGGRG
jgi:hypothetical protein